MMRSSTGILIGIGIFLMSASWFYSLLMVVDIVPFSFIAIFVCYGAGTSGLFLGFMGLFCRSHLVEILREKEKVY